MNREMEFRGQRVDTKEWVYGYLFGIWEQRYILWGTTNGAPNMIEVIPETVGQYTGREDKRGQKIYEGDIFNMGDKNIRYSVVWHDNGFMGRQFHCLGSYCGLTYFNSSIEVMGNIHEHIELLEVSE